MKYKAITGIMLTLLFTSMLALAFNIQSVKSEPFIEIDIGAYWDFNCSNTISSVDWDSIEPGSSKNIDIFLRNEGNVSVTLSIATSNWNPPEAADFIHLTWNYTGEIIEESHVIPVTLSLHVDVGIKGISAVTFDANMVAHGSLVSVLSISMFVFVRCPTWTLEIDPDVFNLKSKGRWITCYIELPEAYNISDIDRATILLNGTIPVDPFWVDKTLESVTGDYDDDGNPDLMVKFSRVAVIEYLLGQNTTHGKVTLTVIGELYDGNSFEGSDMIRVKIPSDVNSNCDECASNLYSADEWVDNYKLVVPEFPSFLILPLFMITTLLAVIVYRRKHSM